MFTAVFRQIFLRRFRAFALWVAFKNLIQISWNTQNDIHCIWMCFLFSWLMDVVRFININGIFVQLIHWIAYFIWWRITFNFQPNGIQRARTKTNMHICLTMYQLKLSVVSLHLWFSFTFHWLFIRIFHCFCDWRSMPCLQSCVPLVLKKRFFFLSILFWRFNHWSDYKTTNDMKINVRICINNFVQIYDYDQSSHKLAAPKYILK